MTSSATVDWQWRSGHHRFPPSLSFLMLLAFGCFVFFFFSSRRRHTRCSRDWSSDVCSSDLLAPRVWPRRFRLLLHLADVQALAAILLALQSAPRIAGSPDALHALRAGLDTLYGGDFEGAAAYFATLAARAPTDPAPGVFQAGAYIWWASAPGPAALA